MIQAGENCSVEMLHTLCNQIYYSKDCPKDWGKAIIVPLHKKGDRAVIVISKLLKRHSKAKRRAPAYSRALRQIRGVFQRIVRGRLRSGCQRVRECVKSEGFSKE